MDLDLKSKLIAHVQNYASHRGQKGLANDENIVKIPYGTAGFRGESTEIERLFFNVGLIAGLRCIQSRANIGVMITASHNPVQDNGVKLVDADGGMLATEWESLVEEFCNEPYTSKLVDKLDLVVKENNIDIKNRSGRSVCSVMIGMDTRPSSEALVQNVKIGLECWSSLIEVIDYGTVTTPALHYMVGSSNSRQLNRLKVQDYYDELITCLMDQFKDPKDCKLYKSSNFIVDCANGVGCETMRNLMQSENFTSCLQVSLINDYDGVLNRDCGADFVKTTQKRPSNADKTGVRYASLDGDADRLVYFCLEEDSSNDKVILVDGDKILTLYAIYIRDLLREANLDSKLTVGIVQTCYANGASTNYIEKTLGFKVDFVQTGVKNLHHKAKEYDIAVYFEANGHGTIYISPEAKTMINKGGNEAKELKLLVTTISNYTGDAIYDMILVEIILCHYDWDLLKWNQIYAELPSCLLKTQVKDRTKIKTTDADRICTEPVGLQPEIDKLVAEAGEGSRCFVRPSGTENVVRIYSEAGSLDKAQSLANRVKKIVESQLC